jgi:hypothetical protein
MKNENDVPTLNENKINKKKQTLWLKCYKGILSPKKKKEN